MSLACAGTVIAKEAPFYQSGAVSLSYDENSGIYKVRKNGKTDSKRIVQSYEDLTKMADLVKSLGGEVDEELARTLNNHLMKSLKAPTTKQIIEVGVDNFSSIESIATDAFEINKGCSSMRRSLPESKAPRKIKIKKKKGWFCASPSKDELKTDWSADTATAKAKEERAFMKKWLGPNLKQKIKLDTYNDNFLHGGRIKMTGEDSADDRARTFGYALGYNVEGDDGSLSIRYNSHLFSKFAPQKGKYGFLYYRDDAGKTYLNAMEETTLDIKGTRNFVGDSSLYGIGSISLRELSDEDRGSQSVQEYWHEVTGSLQYNYLEHMDNEYSLEAKVGVGKKVEGNLGKWRCRAKLEGLVGVDIWNLGRGEIEVNASVGIDSGSMGGRSKNNPWIIIDAYTNQSLDTDNSRDSMYGAKISTSFKVGETHIRPFMGIELYDEKSDRMFQTAEEGNELIHTIGIDISF